MAFKCENVFKNPEDFLYWGRMLKARNLTKTYGKCVALDGVNVDIAPGEILGLLGSNGAGKTTLVSIVAGLRTQDHGSVRIGGFDPLTDPLETRRLIGVASQELALYLQLTVLENFRFFGKLAGIPHCEIDSRIEEVAFALDLVELFDRSVQELSGGEKRRLHTCVALVHRPPLLLLDEPTAGVDIRTRNRLLKLIKQLAHEGTAICYATHYLQEIERLGASVTILEQGSVIAKGKVEDLIESSAGIVVEIRLDGPVPPEFVNLGNVDEDPSLLRIRTANPGVELTNAITSMGQTANRINSVEIIQPSLESVYLTITGRRFEAQATQEVE